MASNKQQHCERTKCPVACALDIVGDKWTLLLIRDLMFFNRHEYKELLAAEEGISTNILSDRLDRLLDYELIDVIPHPEYGTRKLYYLTQSGKDLIHTLTHLVRWSSKHLDDLVYIPKEKLKLLRNNPDQMIELTLKELNKWEKEYIVEL